MKLFFKHKKIFSRILIIPVIISLSFSSLTASKAYAILGVGDVGVVNVINTPLNPVQVGNTLNPNALKVSDAAIARKYIGITVLGHTVPGFSWNGIYNLVMKTLLAQITDSIVNWINSGFEGSPSFVTDPQSFLLDVGDEVVGEFINEMTKFGWLCDPYRLNIQIALSLGIGSFKRQRKCTLTGIIKNFDNFVNGTFKEGGWKGWFYLTTNPNANPGTAMLSVQAELQKRMLQKNDMEVSKLNWGRGFMSWRTCEQYATKTSTPSDAGPGFEYTDETTEKDKSNESQECTKYSDIKTPGSVIESQLEHTLGTSLRQLELADDIDKIVGALVQQLVKTVLTKGLSSMNSSDGWEGTSSDLEEQSSDTKITGACTADTGSALTGETVEWSVYAVGGPSNKTPEYKWNGNEIETNTETEKRTLSITYTGAGTKKARVTVKKGNKSTTIKCSGSVKVAAGDDSDVASGTDGYCSANKSAIKTGSSVKWTWTPYASDSSYSGASYEWKDEDGNAIEDADSTKSITLSYFEAGEKSVGVDVTKDGEISNYDCGTVDVADGDGSSPPSEESITADSCSVDKTSALVNQTVKWTAKLADENDVAIYNWLSDDADGPSGDTESVEVGYTTTGTKSANVEIVRDGATTTASCSNSVEITNTKLSASCSVDPIAGAVDTGNNDGTEFTWTATASGWVGDYGYDWSGTDDLIGSEETTATTYTEAGNKTAQVTVTSGDESVTVKCGGTARVFSE